MRSIVRIALLDLKRTVRDRTSFVWLLVMPIAFMWMFGHVGGGGSGPPKISLTVVNQDDGWLSETLLEELEDDRIHLRLLEPAEAESAESLVRTLIIPEGFTGGVLAGEQQKLRLESESGSNQEFGLAAQAHIVRAIVRLVARLAEMGEPGEPGDPERADAARQRMRELAARPRLVRLEVSSAGEGRPVPSGRAQSVPGIITFTVMMMTLTTARSGSPRRRRAERCAASPPCR